MSLTINFKEFNMAIKDTFKHLKDLLVAITHDLDKAEGGNKAASQRVRTGTVKLEKLAKLYRKESIKSEKQTKGTKKTVKKAAHKAAHKPAAKAAHKPAAHKPAAHKPAAKLASKPAAKPASKTAAKVKAQPKAKAVSRPRALSFKKPSAKLPVRKVHR
jgi:hypothetical protein